MIIIATHLYNSKGVKSSQIYKIFVDIFTDSIKSCIFVRNYNFNTFYHETFCR